MRQLFTEATGNSGLCAACLGCRALRTRTPSSRAVNRYIGARCVRSAPPPLLCCIVQPPTCGSAKSLPACSHPVEKPSGARCSRLESYGSLPAPRLSRQAARAAARFHGTLLTCASDAASFGLHCDAMLRAGHAHVGYRGARVGSDCVERHFVNSLDAPARPGRLPPPLGFRCALRRCSLRVPVPHLALRARRESFAGVSLRVRSQAKRSAEVRLALCLTVLSSHVGLWCCRCRRLAHPSLCG